MFVEKLWRAVGEVPKSGAIGTDPDQGKGAIESDQIEKGQGQMKGEREGVIARYSYNP